MARLVCLSKPKTLAFALALAVGVSALATPAWREAIAAQSLSQSALRGTSGTVAPAQNGYRLRSTYPATRQPTSLVYRGSQSQYQGAEVLEEGPVSDVEEVLYEVPEGESSGLLDDHHETGFMDDLNSTFLYLRDNIVPVLTFRGSTDAVEERNVTYTLPEHGPLRNSIMHSANVYEGLRSGSAGVGDSVSAALRGSYSSRASLERANVDRARMHSAMAVFFPRVEGSVTVSKSDLTTTTSESRGEVGSAGIEVSMPIYTSGVNSNLYKQAQHNSLASDHNYLAEEHRVALEAVTAHVNLRLNRRVERSLKQNVHAMQQIANIARRLFEAGDSSKTDIAIAQANVESARAELDLARKSREEVQAEFESITGKHAPRSLNGSVARDLVPSSLEEALATAVAHNPTLASSVHAALASKHAAKAERGRYGPQVNLFGSYNHEFMNSDDDKLDQDWRMGVRLRMPLFDATMAPNVNAARHEALENGYRALDQRRLVERQVETQWVAYKSAQRRVSIVQRQVNSLAQSLDGARREYEAGFRSVTDVLSEQVKLTRAKITLENVRHEKMLAAYQLAFTTATPKLRQLAAMR